MKLFEQLESLIQEAKEDATRFYKKGNSAAGTRLRKKMMAIKKLSAEIRTDVSETKNQGN